MAAKAALSFDATIVATLIREATSPPRDVADGGCPGLTLRLSPTAAAWHVRARYEGKQHRVLLGDARTWTLPQARAVAVEVRRHIDAGMGEPAREWIELKRSAIAREAKRRRGQAAGEEIAVPDFMPRTAPPATWTYGEARAAWREWMKREAAAGGLRDATVRNYSGVVGGPSMRTLDKRFVSRIEAPDVCGHRRVPGLRGQAFDGEGRRPRYPPLLGMDVGARPGPAVRRQGRRNARAQGAPPG